MKKYILLIVAVASMLAGSCLKNIDEDDFVLSTTFTGKVVKSNGEPLVGRRIIISISDWAYREECHVVSTYTDSEGNFSLTVEYKKVGSGVPEYLLIHCKGDNLNSSSNCETIKISGYGQRFCDLGVINLTII